MYVAGIPQMSIVAMSGDYQEEAVPAGIIADRYYPKGQHPHQLLTVIASLIRRIRAAREAARR